MPEAWQEACRLADGLPQGAGIIDWLLSMLPRARFVVETVREAIPRFGDNAAHERPPTSMTEEAQAKRVLLEHEWPPDEIATYLADPTKVQKTLRRDLIAVGPAAGVGVRLFCAFAAAAWGVYYQALKRCSPPWSGLGSWRSTGAASVAR